MTFSWFVILQKIQNESTRKSTGMRLLIEKKSRINKDFVLSSSYRWKFHRKLKSIEIVRN